MGDTLLTPEQVAQRLQVTKRTVYKWLSEGRLKGTKLGRLWRIRPEELETYLDPNGRNGDDEPLSAEDWAALREGIDAIRRGDTVTLEEYDRERQQRR